MVHGILWGYCGNPEHHERPSQTTSVQHGDRRIHPKWMGRRSDKPTRAEWQNLVPATSCGVQDS
ncbi:hypothetical protein T03_9960 [Trichinella britovi]|uniref:Uncharacterized protein n=1 Tax=Trichinella britovi TaxID=45882 RepID=A0A0V0YXJ1_TRIBR|nr:hypothetical protein T03_9960 [Trichinella britovi]